MSNFNDEKNHSSTFDFQLYNEDEIDEKIKELDRKIAEEVALSKKRTRRLKIFAFALLGYMALIVISAIVAIFIPSMRVVANTFLFYSNIIAVFLVLWSMRMLFKGGAYKGKHGKALIAFSIFAILLNLFAIFDDWLFSYFFNI